MWDNSSEDLSKGYSKENDTRVQRAGEKISQLQSTQQCCKSTSAGCRPEMPGGSSEVPSSPTASPRSSQAPAVSTASSAPTANHRELPPRCSQIEAQGAARGCRQSTRETEGMEM